jgi:hypothetical protein
MSKINKDRLEIIELFCAKASMDRCFFGIIKRFEDHLGNPLVFSKIIMPEDGYIVAQAEDQKELSKNLNEMCTMILDKGLHAEAGISTKIFDEMFFLN